MPTNPLLAPCALAVEVNWAMNVRAVCCAQADPKAVTRLDPVCDWLGDAKSGDWASLQQCRCVT